MNTVQPLVNNCLTGYAPSMVVAFLILMMDENTPDLWTGLSNLVGKGFRWTDGSPVHYTGWAKGDNKMRV